MSIQSSVNQGLGLIDAGLLAGSKVAQDKKANKLKIDQEKYNYIQNKENVVEDIRNYRNNIIEGIYAIKAHNEGKEFNPQYTVVETDKETGKEVKIKKDLFGLKGKPLLDAKGWESLNNNQLEELSKQLQDYRAGTLTENRVERLQEASRNASKLKKENDESEEDFNKRKKAMLDPAYTALRELNERQTATNALRARVNTRMETVKAMEKSKLIKKYNKEENK